MCSTLHYHRKVSYVYTCSINDMRAFVTRLCFSTHCVNSASSDVVHTTTEMVTHMCNSGVFIEKGNMTWTNKTYSESKGCVYVRVLEQMNY